MLKTILSTLLPGSKGRIFVSTNDHFVSSNAIYNSVVEAGVFHSGENLSNHSPFFVKVVLETDIKVTEFNISRRKVSWGKSTTEARENYVVTFK